MFLFNIVNFVGGLIYRNRDITEEENPYDAVTIEEETKIYEDLVSYQKVPVGQMLFFSINLINCKYVPMVPVIIQNCSSLLFLWLESWQLFYVRHLLECRNVSHSLLTYNV